MPQSLGDLERSPLRPRICCGIKAGASIQFRMALPEEPEDRPFVTKPLLQLGEWAKRAAIHELPSGKPLLSAFYAEHEEFASLGRGFDLLRRRVQSLGYSVERKHVVGIDNCGGAR